MSQLLSCWLTQQVQDQKGLSFSILAQGASQESFKTAEGIAPTEQLSPVALDALGLALPYYKEVAPYQRPLSFPCFHLTRPPDAAAKYLQR